MKYQTTGVSVLRGLQNASSKNLGDLQQNNCFAIDQLKDRAKPIIIQVITFWWLKI